MEANGAVFGVVRDLGSEDCVGSGGEVKRCCCSTQRGMKVEIRVGGFSDCLPVSALRLGHRSGDECGGHRRERDEAETLMNLEHFCAFV